MAAPWVGAAAALLLASAAGAAQAWLLQLSDPARAAAGPYAASNVTSFCPMKPLARISDLHARQLLP